MSGNTSEKSSSSRWSKFRMFNSADDQQTTPPEAKRYAALTDSGDVCLAIKQLSTIQPRKRKQQQKQKHTEYHEDKDSDEEDEDDDSELHGEIFLDVYGDDPFEKVQKLIDDVMNESNLPNLGGRQQTKAGNAAASNGMVDMFSEYGDENEDADNEPGAHKQLFWFDLKGWNSKRNDGVIQPIYNKKPMHGDRKQQKEYHQSFFHPDKDRLIGKPGYSLVDKFQNNEGPYAIAGVQRKLNFLMHGPPGTGKSMFVRTAAMYLQRHVVSFSLGQVKTEGQWLTLLDSLKTITDDPKTPANDMTFDDVIFIIEEIDTDERKLCVQRMPEDTKTHQTKVEEPESDQKEPKEDSDKGAWKPKGEGKAKRKEEAPSDPPLSLGAILRGLDGGSEAPGRMLVMTTNAEESLDAAFKRPGRVKKIRMDNLAFHEFKLMILHFLPNQETGSSEEGHLLPTVVPTSCLLVTYQYLLHLNQACVPLR